MPVDFCRHLVGKLWEMSVTVIALKHALLVSQWSYEQFLKLTDSILFEQTRYLTQRIMSWYTHKMAIESSPQTLWRHFTLCIYSLQSWSYWPGACAHDEWRPVGEGLRRSCSNHDASLQWVYEVVACTSVLIPHVNFDLHAVLPSHKRLCLDMGDSFDPSGVSMWAVAGGARQRDVRCFIHVSSSFYYQSGEMRIVGRLATNVDAEF